jgi:hypothetical protein
VASRDTIHALLARRDLAPSDALQALSAHRSALELASLRTRELIEHALGEDALRPLAAQVRELRPAWNVRHAPLQQAEGLVAWVFVAGPATDELTLSPAPA